MKKILILLLSALLLCGCGAAELSPTSAPAETEAFDPEVFLQEIRPSLEGLDQVDQELFGAQVDWEQKYAAGYEDGVLTVLYPRGQALPQGCDPDPADADYFPISNYQELSQVRDYMEAFLSPELTDRFSYWQENFLQMEDGLYLCRGGRGYGALWFEPESLRYLDPTPEGHRVTLDYYLFDQFDHTATLTLVPSPNGWQITEISEN